MGLTLRMSLVFEKFWGVRLNVDVDRNCTFGQRASWPQVIGEWIWSLWIFWCVC